MNNGFFINEVNIRNFRGYKQQDFNFFTERENKSGLILLGGPNGYGKTSLLDAVEWCLTGTITRIVDDYELRRERNKKMQKCLLRHNGSTNEVRVLLKVDYRNEPLEIERVFNGSNEIEGFFPEYSTFKVNGHEIEGNQTIDQIIGRKIASDFYERYTSSYEKNIRVYEKGREDIYNMFSSFFGGTKELENIILNLDGPATKKAKLTGLIDQLDSQIQGEFKPIYEIAKTRYEESKQKVEFIIEDRKENGQLSNYIKDYPDTLTYNNELKIEDILSDEKSYHEKMDYAQKQVDLLKKIKYVKKMEVAFRESKSYTSNLVRQKELHDFSLHILDPFKKLQEEVKSIQGINLEELELEKTKQESLLNDIYPYKEPSKGGVIKLKKFGVDVLEKNEEEIEKFNLIDTHFEEYAKISNQLEGFKSSDPALNALRSLVDHSQGFHELRNEGQEECPLCGSKELFPDHTNQLVKKAEEILGDVDLKRSNLQKSFTEQRTKINNVYNKFYQHLVNTVEGKLASTRKLISNFERTKELRVSCLSFNLNFNEIDEAVLEGKQQELQSAIMDNTEMLVLETSILERLENDQGELESIPNLYNENLMNRNDFIQLDTNDKLQSIQKFTTSYQKLVEEIPSDVEMEVVREEILLQKVEILEAVEKILVSDKALQEARNKLGAEYEKFKQQEQIYNRKQNELKALKQISTDLKKKRNEWDRKMVEEIRTPLQQIYRRINRHTNIEEINLIMDGQTKTKASLVANVSNESVSATNILSAGQLSVVALSIFLTVAMGQKDGEFKCYFMDDPIQTMDDLNILSFIDLLRTELAGKNENERFVDQLFFTTCDENLESLMTHKMKHFGVNYTHFHFTGYGEYEVLS